MPSELWPGIAAALPRPFGEDAARFDLRWHADQGSLPSRRQLAARWGWTEGEVRTLLRRPDRWWDPMKGPAPTSREELTQGRPGVTQGRPDLTQREQENAANQDELTHPDPGTTRADPTTATRALISPSHSPSPPQEEEQCRRSSQLTLVPDEPSSLKADRYDEAARYFGEVVHRQLRRRTSHGPDRKSKLGQALLKAVRADADLVLDAMRFVAESDSQRATFLREKYASALTITTILRHAEEYAELWRAEQDPRTEKVLPFVPGAHPGSRELTPEEQVRIAEDFALYGLEGRKS